MAMSSILLSPGRRSFLATAAAASAAGVLPVKLLAATTTEKVNTMNPELKDDNAIRPFRVHVPDEAIADLRRRIAVTRWPPRETVNDRSQGAQLAKIQPLVRYWGTDYDWRKVEAQLNALPQFMTRIDGLDIHFVHVRR
jgi:hypothetical protein